MVELGLSFRAEPDPPDPSASPRSRLAHGRQVAYHRAAMKPKLKVWVTFGDRLNFGDGRADLLELIEERGSLRAAAQVSGMSYRNAWGYLRELESAAGFKFVERVKGGGPQSGMHLTKAGKNFVVRYRKFRSGLDAVARRHFERSFRA